MAIPQGNFVALQALKPKEYKIGDLYLQMTDYLIKKGEAEKAAKIKAAQERQKTWDDVSKNYKVDSFSTIDKFSDDSQKLFRQAYDLNAYHTSILKDPNASESEKQKSLNVLNNIQRDYLSFSTVLKDPKFIEGYQKRKDAIAKGEYFDKDPDLAVNMAFEAGLAEWGFAEDGSLKAYTPERFGDDSVKPKSLGEMVQAFTTLPTPDLVKGKDGFLEQIYQKGADMRKEWTDDTGITKIAWEKFSNEKADTYLNAFVGKEYDPNRHGTKSKEWQLAVGTFGFKDLNESNYDEFRKEIKNILTIKAPDSRKVDVARPTTINIDNGEKLITPSIIQSGSIYRKKGNNLEQIDNAAVLDFGAKGQFAAIKVPNSKKDKNGKRGYHVEYAILGKDQFGRSVYEEITQKTDVTTRLQNLKYDPAVLEKAALKNEQYKVKLLNSKKDVGEIKYYGAASDPFQ